MTEEKKVVLRMFPVLYACPGCPRGGQAARDVAQVLDRRGLGEAAWLGGPAGQGWTQVSRARSRFPIFAVDGCQAACAQRWLSRHGVSPQHTYVLSRFGEMAPEGLAERVAADW